MKSLLKLIGAVVLIVILGSFLLDSQPVSNVLQTSQGRTDPLLAGAKTVKQELRSLTDQEHQEAYKNTFKLGLKKAADLLNGLTEDQPKVPALPNPDANNSPKSI